MQTTLKATYEMVKNYVNKPTNYWLAISEFIDNSIASYQENILANPIVGLVIDIVFDFRNENNKKIIISDNANGMSESDLLDAAQPYKTEGKSDQQYNQFGIGMKLGIFWFGKDGHIYTKQKNNKEYYLDFSTSNKKIDQEIELHTIESTDNKVKCESGTTIEIENVYDNRCFKERAALQKFKDALGWRYNKLLEKGMVIKITYKSLDDSNSENCENHKINPYFNTTFRLQQLLDNRETDNYINNNDKKEKLKFSEETKKQREKFLNLKIKELNIELKKIENSVGNDFKKEVIEKFCNNEYMNFKKEIKINNKKVQLKFSVMNAMRTKKIQYSGVTIYHLDRAIMHGPNDDAKNTNFMFKELKLNSPGDPKYRWLYGEMDLTGIEIPDENKSRFNWSATAESDIKKELSSIVTDLEEILQIIVDVNDKIKDNKKSNDKEIKEIKNQTKKKFNDELYNWKTIKDENKNNGIQTTIKLDNTGLDWKITIFESFDADFYFLKQKIDEKNKTIDILIDAQHMFWKPLITQQDFKGELLYPISIMLSISDYLYNNSESTNIFDKNSNKTFIEILNDIMQRYSD